MKQPWIHSSSSDMLWIISPPFLTLIFILVFSDSIIRLSESFDFISWLFLIVFIDVAHVYSTLFKTYFVKSEFNKHKIRYITVPIISFTISVALYSFGELTFWSTLACVAIFHFVRQQYGIMRIYDRFEKRRFLKFIDSLAIYSATLFPIIYWIYTPKKFNWFLENEFLWLDGLPNFLPIISFIYLLILSFWLIITIRTIVLYKQINIPKTLFIIGTILSWYFGIIYFNNDLIFTMLNVISHGIPYLGLIYMREIQVNPNNSSFIGKFRGFFGLFMFIALILILAFSEEFLWEVFVWQNHFNLDINLSNYWLKLLIPLLATPQLCHYLLDGFIWKNPKHVEASMAHQ